MGVQTSDGERVLRILPGIGLEPAGPWPALTAEGFHDVPGWRVLRAGAEGAVIEAAHATAWRREEMLEAASAFLVLALPLIAVLLWALRRTTDEAAAPVHALARRISARRPDDFTPIGAADLPQELQPLAAAFGGYLSRIDTLRQAERDFIANAAHELRTPLAVLRGRLDQSGHPEAAGLIEPLDSLTRRIERLLQLARVEAGLGRGPADLLRILHLLIDDARPRSRHPIRLDDGDLEALPVAADADALAILLRNLLENAQDHGTGPVHLRLSADGTLTIENPTTTTEFARPRFDKGAGSAGLGLGMSIIEAVAGALGAPLTCTISEGRARVVLQFPLASSA
jgi:two-component system OmpR family sensor kinase